MKMVSLTTTKHSNTYLYLRNYCNTLKINIIPSLLRLAHRHREALLTLPIQTGTSVATEYCES